MTWRTSAYTVQLRLPKVGQSGSEVGAQASQEILLIQSDGRAGQSEVVGMRTPHSVVTEDFPISENDGELLFHEAERVGFWKLQASFRSGRCLPLRPLPSSRMELRSANLKPSSSSSASSSSAAVTSVQAQDRPQVSSTRGDDEKEVLDARKISVAAELSSRKDEEMRTFCANEGIQVHKLEKGFKLKSQVGSLLKDSMEHEGCSAPIWIKSFRNSDLVFVSVEFRDSGANEHLHRCGIEMRPLHQKFFGALMEKVKSMLNQGMSVKVVHDKLVTDFAAEQADGVSHIRRKLATLRWLEHMFDSSEAVCKLAKTDEDDLRLRLLKDKQSRLPVIRACKLYGIAVADGHECFFGFEGCTPPKTDEIFIAIADAEMIQNLKSYGNVIYSDGTHNVSKRKGM